MRGGVRIGSIFGIDISLSYSWFIIFLLVTWGLSGVLFPQSVPGLSVTVYALMGVITSLLFFGSVLFHEVMHSLVAKQYGLPIEGITLLVFGGVSRLAEEPHTPEAEFKMAAAGPLSSLLLGILFLGFFIIASRMQVSALILAPALWLGYINIVLGVFNFLPGFPLDGGRVLRSAVWYYTGSLRRATGIAALLGKTFGYVFMLVGIFGLVTGSVNLAWFLFLGWILTRAAEEGYQQVIYMEALQGIKVRDAMTSEPDTVDPNLSLEDMVKKQFMQHKWVAYPVVENDAVHGMITIKSIEKVPRRSWKRKRVRDVMRPLSRDIVATPDDELTEVMPKLTTKAEGRMLVVHEQRLLGILTRVDVHKAILRRARLEARETEAQQKAA